MKGSNLERMVKPSIRNGKEKYYAFFDAEYTCYMNPKSYFDRKHTNEVLSVGLVITNQKFQKKAQYYSVIHPVHNPVLTGYCKRLTGLTQEEVDTAPGYEEVFGNMYTILQKYPVKEIFVWGNDNRTLMDDVKKNHQGVPKYCEKIINKVSDITKRLTAKAFGKAVPTSLSDMKYICGMKRETAHNALDDALDLYRITKCILENKHNKDRTRTFYAYTQNRDAYHRFRKFVNTPAMEYKNETERVEMQKAAQKYIDDLKKCNKEYMKKPECLAFCDDLRHMVGLEAKDCPKMN